MVATKHQRDNIQRCLFSILDESVEIYLWILFLLKYLAWISNNLNSIPKAISHLDE